MQAVRHSPPRSPSGAREVPRCCSSRTTSPRGSRSRRRRRSCAADASCVTRRASCSTSAPTRPSTASSRPCMTEHAASSPPGTFAAAWLVARKDLAIEFRTRTAFLSALVFALLGVTIFYFAWDSTAVAASDLAPGVLWVIFIFAALLGLQRSFGSELADRAIDGLLGAPVSRESIYIGKALANLVFVCGVLAVTLPAVVLFYNL